MITRPATSTGSRAAKPGSGRHVALPVETVELARLDVVSIHTQRLDHLLPPPRRAVASEVAGGSLVPGGDAL